MNGELGFYLEDENMLNLVTSSLSRIRFVSIISAGLFVYAPAVAGEDAPDFELVNVTIDANINQSSDFPFYMQQGRANGGVAAADFDHDGDIDLFVPTIEGEIDILYRNIYDAQTGQTGFEPVDFLKDYVGIDHSSTKFRSRGALWIDFDGDRLLDLMVFGDAFSFGANPSWLTPRLYRQRHDGSFADVTDAVGLNQMDFIDGLPNNDFLLTRRILGGLCAGDLDGDGYPEVFMGFWTTEFPSTADIRNGRLLQNIATENGRKFVQTVGVLTTPIEDNNGNLVDNGEQLDSMWQSMMVDVDGDGDLDIISAVDGEDNHLWINETTTQGEIILVQSNELLGLDNIGRADMGVSVGDYDNDGDFDFCIDNLNLAPSNGTDLLRNDMQAKTPEDRRFHEVSDEARIGIFGLISFQWGTTFADLDSDGWLDLLIVCGENFAIGPEFIGRTHIYMNNESSANPSDPSRAGRLFHDLTWPFGTPENEMIEILTGSSLIALDYDRDADLDFFITSQEPELYLYEHQAVGPNLGQNLIVQPLAGGANSHSIGTKVTVFVDRPGTEGDMTLTRVIATGSSLLGQEPAEVHFGLGDINKTTNITVTVDWIGDDQPTDIIQLTGKDILAPGGSFLKVGWCSFADLAQPYGVHDMNDIKEFISLYYAASPRADFSSSMNGQFGTLNFFDVSAFIQRLNAGCD